MAFGTGLLLAVGASTALNGSYLLQHAGTRGAPALVWRRPMAALRTLLGSPAWLAGGAAGMFGWLLFVLALARVPLVVLQAFAGAGLVLTVPAAAHAFRDRLAATDVAAVAALAVALVALTVASGGPTPAHVPVATLAWTGGAGLLVAGALVGWSARRGGRRAGPTTAAAAGVLYGLADGAIKAATIDARHGLVAALLSPWAVAAALASIGAFLTFQRALQAGPPVPVIALMTVGTGAASAALGLLGLHESLGRVPAVVAVHAVALVVAAAAALRLGHTQGRLLEPPVSAPELPACGSRPAASPASRRARASSRDRRRAPCS